MKPIAMMIILCGVSICLSGCFLANNEKEGHFELVPIIINNEYSLDVPSYMEKVTNLNAEASLQFQNPLKETYVIVTEEPKSEFADAPLFAELDSAATLISTYADVYLEIMGESITITSQTPVKTFTLKGLKAASSQVDGTVEGIPVPISYFFTFVEGPDRVYTIMAWTLQSRKETYRNTFTKMSKSFKLKRGNLPV